MLTCHEAAAYLLLCTDHGQKSSSKSALIAQISGKLYHILVPEGAKPGSDAIQS